jgi:hypothetical protein
MRQEDATQYIGLSTKVVCVCMHGTWSYLIKASSLCLIHPEDSDCNARYTENMNA